MNHAKQLRPIPNLNVDGSRLGRDMIREGKSLWIASSAVERPKGTLVHFGALLLAATDEDDALAQSERILDRAYPEADGYVHSFDVFRPNLGDLEFGVVAYRQSIGIR